MFEPSKSKRTEHELCVALNRWLRLDGTLSWLGRQHGDQWRRWINRPVIWTNFISFLPEISSNFSTYLRLFHEILLIYQIFLEFEWQNLKHEISIKWSEPKVHRFYATGRLCVLSDMCILELYLFRAIAITCLTVGKQNSTKIAPNMSTHFERHI